MITNLNEFRKKNESGGHANFGFYSIGNNQPKPTPTPKEGECYLKDLKSGDHHHVFPIQNAIVKLMNQSDNEIVASFVKGMNAYGQDGEDVAAEYVKDEAFIKRMVDEWRRDCKFAIENIGDFIEGLGPKANEIANNDEELGSAIAAYANTGDPLEYLGENKKYKIIKESVVTATLPNIQNKEQLIAHISNNIQKAMDIFTVQVKMPNITVTIKNDYLNCISEMYEGDELGIFKHGVSKAQIQAANSSKISINEDGSFAKILWGTFSLRYEVLGGGSNGVNYMFADNDNQFMYDIVENKFYTRKDFFSKTEKRQTGYNTKRI